MKSDTKLPFIKTFPPQSTTKAYGAKRINASQRNSWINNWNWRMGPIAPKHDDSYLYTVPFSEGKQFKISQGYNGPWTHNNDFAYSIDWDMPVGTPILAARDGVVIFILDHYSGHSMDPSYLKRTNTITILHDDGTQAEYSHIDTRSAKVKVGQRVQAGDKIALSGNVGFTKTPHLHFRVHRLIKGLKFESLPVIFKDVQGKTVKLGR